MNPYYYPNTYKAEGVTPAGRRVSPLIIDALAPADPRLLSRGQSQDLCWVSSVKN